MGRNPALEGVRSLLVNTEAGPGDDKNSAGSIGSKNLVVFKWEMNRNWKQEQRQMWLLYTTPFWIIVRILHQFITSMYTFVY